MRFEIVLDSDTKEWQFLVDGEPLDPQPTDVHVGMFEDRFDDERRFTVSYSQKKNGTRHSVSTMFDADMNATSVEAEDISIANRICKSVKNHIDASAASKYRKRK